MFLEAAIITFLFYCSYNYYPSIKLTLQFLLFWIQGNVCKRSLNTPNQTLLVTTGNAECSHIVMTIWKLAMQ